MKAWVFTSKEDAGGWIEQDTAGLPDLPVLVRITHSGINYKDALSLTRRAPIARTFPMAAGSDFVGSVIEDRSGAFSPGEIVVATGNGLGETTWGGYAEEARVRPEWLARLPIGLSQEQAAAVGTAGITAAMAIDALERFGVAADQGPVLVTGPTGGVGSFASILLKYGGYHVIAATGRLAESEFKANGAAEVIDRAELEGEPRSLGKERWRASVRTCANHGQVTGNGDGSAERTRSGAVGLKRLGIWVICSTACLILNMDADDVGDDASQDRRFGYDGISGRFVVELALTIWPATPKAFVAIRVDEVPRLA